MFDLHDPKNLKHVRNIFFQRFFYQTMRLGLDPEDVLQDIYLTIWKRNKPGTEFTPYDPARGCKSTYLIKVCRSILSHKRTHHNSPAFGKGAEHLPLQIEDEQSGEIQDLILLPSQDPGDGGSTWERAAELAGIPLEVLKECADGRDLEAERRTAEREERRRAAEEAAAARAARMEQAEVERAAKAARRAEREAARREKKTWYAAYRAEREAARRAEDAQTAARRERDRVRSAARRAARKGKAPSQG